MFGKNEVLHREYYWTDTATKISAIRIGLIDQKTTTLKVREKSENKNLPHPEASRVIITSSPQNNDLILDYFQDDNRLAQEIISGHTIARVSDNKQKSDWNYYLRIAFIITLVATDLYY
jgi:hypothetical protein